MGGGDAGGGPVGNSGRSYFVKIPMRKITRSITRSNTHFVKRTSLNTMSLDCSRIVLALLPRPVIEGVWHITWGWLKFPIGYKEWICFYKTKFSNDIKAQNR